MRRFERFVVVERGEEEGGFIPDAATVLPVHRCCVSALPTIRECTPLAVVALLESLKTKNRCRKMRNGEDERRMSAGRGTA
jgi:hypothetical protein